VAYVLGRTVLSLRRQNGFISTRRGIAFRAGTRPYQTHMFLCIKLIFTEAAHIEWARVVAIQEPKPDGKGALAIALITASLTLVGIVLKDLLFKILEERRAEKKIELAVYERYSKPLAASANHLLHRLHEMLLTENRPVFLKPRGVAMGAGPAFWAYKKLSTLYRLAALMGWIRACRREFSYLPLAEKEGNDSIGRAIDAFEKALADGSWVEGERVRRLCDIWHICDSNRLETSPEIFAAVGVRVDNMIYQQSEMYPDEDIRSLDDAAKEDICRKVAGLLAEGLNTNHVDRVVMQKTWPDAFNVIAMREAWIYRDWQAAIGDLMLVSNIGESRKFEVIGYGSFEQICEAANPFQRRWIDRLSEIFDGVDLEIEDRFDARPRQLRTILRATAELVIALHRVQGEQTIISQAAIRTAKDVLASVKIQFSQAGGQPISSNHP
jgi:hypothetical protein